MDKNKEIETNKKQEQTTERETSALFCKAFYDEAREIEARAQKVDLEVDEARMEAMYQRMMAKMASGKTSAGTDAPDDTANYTRGDIAEGIKDKKPHHEKEGRERTATENMVDTSHVSEKTGNAGNSGENSETMAESTSGKVVTMPGKSSRHMLRWVAVLALVCAGVFGVSMQSQAGKDGLWSSIQRLIGVESRWEQKNNDENREYSDPEEVKAIRNIESTLNVFLPEFFYWPGKIQYVNVQLNEESKNFVLTYEENEQRIYFEGEKDNRDASSVDSWEGEGTTEYVKYDRVNYKIVTVENREENITYYYASWTANDMRYLLSGIDNIEDLKKILKNIKN